MNRKKNIISCIFIFWVFTSIHSQTTNPKDSADHYLNKGIEEKQSGRRLESLKWLEKAYRFDSLNHSVLLELAQAYHDLRRYTQSYALWVKILENKPNDTRALKTLVNLAHQLKLHQDVIRYANQLKKTSPEEKLAFYIGRAYYDMDQYGEAIRYLKIAENEDSLNAETYYLIAHSYTEMSNYKTAIPYFKKAIALKPDPNWIYHLALTYYAVHEDQLALQYMIEAGEKGLSKDNSFLENLAIAYLNAGNEQKGMEMLHEVLKRKPFDLNVLNLIAETYYAKKSYNKAMEYWDKILEFDKNNATALYMIGMCYQQMGGTINKRKGIELCEKAITIDPSLGRKKQKKMNIGL
ncbi:MAG: tetratricopeptide repeat protein [Chitinophagaceae bacterium]|nr:tetratricopeptide repeat protein [Chitinophagaceae bacterium]